MKINRNEPCPCGSKLKYKKCCINKTMPGLNNAVTRAKSVPAHPFFGRYNSFDLLNCVAALSILPENHGKNVRLEKIVHLIMQSYNSKPEKVAYKVFKEYILANFKSDAEEEIPVNLFTDSVTFYNGDNIIFPGITENGGFILSSLLTSVFLWPYTNISDQVKENSFQVSKFLLGLSNRIATSNGYQRYIEGVDSGKLIYFPAEDKFQFLKASLILSAEEMTHFLAEYTIDIHAIDAFLVNPGSDDFETYLEESPLLHKPLIYANNHYLIVSPTTIGFALTHYIWTLSEYFGGIAQVSKPYHDFVWHTAQQQLNMMKFKIMNESDTELGLQLPDMTGLYRFDDDKIAFIQYAYDDGDSYREQPFIAKSIVHLSQKDKEDLIKKLTEAPEFTDYQIFDLVLLSTIGRNFGYGLRSVAPAIPLTIPFYEFNILSHLKECDAIDLWKFAIANQQSRNQFSFLNFSFLDRYNLYRDRENSFHSDTLEYGLPVQYGYSQELYKKSVLKSDIHSVIQEKNGKKIIIKVQKAEDYGPVYLDPAALANAQLEFYVEGFPQGIWVMPLKKIKGVGPGLRHMYWETNSAIAYWLWQISASVYTHLKVLDRQQPITFKYFFQDEDGFENIKRDFNRVSDLANKFKLDVSGFEITIGIPAELLGYLYGPDNEGERVLVRTILYGISKLLSHHGHPPIAQDEIVSIIDKDAPLGMKKKIFILDTSDNLLLDPTNLGRHRYIQKYDVGVTLDQIIKKLGAACPPVGELKTKQEKNSLTNNIVQKALLPLLREKLALYDSQGLLERLLSLYESLLRKREELRIHTPSRIACYVSVKQQQEDLLHNLSRNNRTSIAVRCLIEHIAAEPYQGKTLLSTTAVDEILGIMDQIIDWGSLGDQIHFDLFDIRMGILQTGRIGTDKSAIREIFDPYNESKISENIHDAIETYSQVFPQLNPDTGGDVPTKLDNAFLKDFGITFTRICKFIDALSAIAFNQTTSFGSLVISRLQEAINQYGDDFDETEFQKAIEYLSLSKRGKLEKLPPGCEFIDIMPWRFNRMLSLLRKPLVLVDSDSGKIAYWGPRAVLDSKQYLQDQIMSDRLRVFENSSVKSVLGEYAQKRGDALVSRVVAGLDLSGMVHRTDVYIGPQHELKNDTLIGDIDVMIIDPSEKVFYSIECKSISRSRNIKEMVEEIDKLFGSENNMGWIGKHLRRHDWLEMNRNKILEKYGIDISTYTIKSVFVTQEDMLTPHLKKQNLPLPFLTIYDIERDGLSALRKAVNI